MEGNANAFFMCIFLSCLNDVKLPLLFAPFYPKAQSLSCWNLISTESAHNPRKALTQV